MNKRVAGSGKREAGNSHPASRTPHPEYGFTFVEIFVVICLFSLLSLAVYATFVSGLRMYGRINAITLAQRKVILGLERFSQELRQAFSYGKIGFTGKATEITFPAIINDEINKVTYILEQNALVRKQESLKDILEEKDNVESKNLIPDIEELKFNFSYKEAGKEEFSWKDTWVQEEGLPFFVKLELKTEDNESFVKTIAIQ